ncbi:hypothetical protein P3W85_10540 [Cupriavidus basilensis]|uniref:DUF3142 domain-containing protein n=1 Tax=Cupriavidus basilensis TaxID=68895 RepID=A0ABT6AL98_9BURK|nr:hypothetical protein [Cupriavidus basilensis]MDF3833384.1 hypothetical protein [Cupriavidus basilensis]
MAARADPPRWLALWLAACLLMPSHGGAAAGAAPVYLWAWDRAEDLRWLQDGTPRDARRYGVAYFAVQFDADGDNLRATWRRAPLRVATGTPLLPVLHIEAFSARHAALFNDVALANWTRALAQAIARLGTPAVQIDFEARASQKDFYRALLARLQQQLQGRVRLSVTALAWWCSDPAWLASLPVDEVVPMFFRMGAGERAHWRARLAGPATLPAPCRAAAGVALDELQALGRPAAGDRRRWYVFVPASWRREHVEVLGQWLPP